MSSSWVKWYQRITDTDPEKYAAIKQKERERSRRRREEKKRRWESEPHTRDLIQQRQHEAELGKYVWVIYTWSWSK